MNLQGQELISRATEISNRSLVTLAVAKLMIVFLSIDTASLNILDVSVSVDQLDSASSLVICLLMISHALNWWGDRVSFMKWNSKTQIATSGYGGGSIPLSTKLDIALDSNKVISTKISEMLKRENESKSEQASRQLREELERNTTALSDLIGQMEGMTKFARFYLYVWFLAVPMALGLAAIYATEVQACLAM